MSKNAAHDATTCWQSSAMWIDPDPASSGGMLLSDRIKLYVDRVALIDPFDSEKLGPASYALTVGPEYWFAEHANERGRLLLTPGDKFKIPPNSIVFVSSAETLNVPFYIAGRFNLKLKLIYEGLLVGTGPQVDPGFRGRLSCPLHNISNQVVFLEAGETFAVIDFQKTTPFAQGERWTDAITSAEVRRRGEQAVLSGVNGLPCLTFPSAKLDRTPIMSYLPPGKIVSSSVAGLAAKVAESQTRIDEGMKELDETVQRMNILAFIPVVVVAVTLGAYFFAAINWSRGMQADILRITEQRSIERQALEKRILELEATVKQMETKLAAKALARKP